MKVRDFFGEHEVTLTVSNYRDNGRVALQLWCEDGPYATVSVNLPKEKVPNKETDFFVDTNNCPWAPQFLEENGIAESLNSVGFSGFCVYPMYRLKEEWAK